MMRWRRTSKSSMRLKKCSIWSGGRWISILSPRGNERAIKAMATILLAWELGRGSGHLVRLLPIAEGLARRGHRGCGVGKDLVRAQGILPSHLVTIIQGPIPGNDG